MKPFMILYASLFLGVVLISPNPCSSAEKKSLLEIENQVATDPGLSDLLNFAYLSNPSITASKKSWQIFIEDYRIKKSYPDPQLMATYFPAPIETRLGPQEWNLTLSQTVPFPGTLSRQEKILEADAKISRLKLDKTVKEIMTTVSNAFYELVYIQKAVTIARANLALNQQMSNISQNAHARDKALFYDVAKARARSAQIQYDLLLLEELESTEKVKINTLLNREPDAKIGKAKSLFIREVPYSLDEIYDLAMVLQEDLLIAEEAVHKSEAGLDLTRFENLPTFKLGLFYAGIGAPDVANPPKDAGNDALGIQFGLSLPLWTGKNRGRIAKALAEKEKAKAKKTAIANRTKAEISRLWFKLQNSKRLITLYDKQLIPQALASIQTAETWFREGQGSFADLLEIQATVYNFQLALERAKADYGKTLVKLEQIAGVILDKKDHSTLGGRS